MGRPRELAHRPALDGVRAVAVLAVIGYHVGGRPAGGFLGVDVFFVLSGYLITALLLDEHARTGTIALRAFWARRVRRLLPALLLLIVVAAVVTRAIAVLVPPPGARGDLLAALSYDANWHFIATDQSYFAAYAAASPLRHTWSLAIEEQFYLAWPVLALVALAVGRGSRWVLVGLVTVGTLASALAMAHLYDPTNPSRAYYGTDTRAHDLLAGAALALVLARWPAQGLATGSRRAAAGVAWPAAAAIIVAMALARDDQAIYYRGGALLFAVAVAVALWSVEVAPRSAPGRVLALGPVRWVGRISYGLYLWHWPLLIWLQDDRLDLSSPERSTLVVAGSLAAAIASFAAVERPVRRGTVPWLGHSGGRLAVVAVAGCAVAGLVVVVQTRIAPALRPVAAALGDVSDRECPDGSPAVDGYAWCVRTAPRNPRAPVVAAVGDSTSRALDPGLEAVAAARGWRYVQGGEGGCSVTALLLPLATTAVDEARGRGCDAAIPRLLGAIQRREHPDVWIVADRFLLAPLVVGGTVLAPDDPRRVPLVRAGLERTLEALTRDGSHAVLIATPPQAAPAECLRADPGGVCSQRRFTTSDPATVLADRAFAEAARGLGQRASLVTLQDVLCPGGARCPPVVGGQLARYDGIHYTARFSRRVVALIVARARRVGTAFAHRSPSP